MMTKKMRRRWGWWAAAHVVNPAALEYKSTHKIDTWFFLLLVWTALSVPRGIKPTDPPGRPPYDQTNVDRQMIPSEPPFPLLLP
jgi:hypothetical protein